MSKMCIRDSNNLTSYEGDGGILLGGFLRRMILALDQSDLAKLPFSDDVKDVYKRQALRFHS